MREAPSAVHAAGCVYGQRGRAVARAWKTQVTLRQVCGSCRSARVPAVNMRDRFRMHCHYRLTVSVSGQVETTKSMPTRSKLQLQGRRHRQALQSSSVSRSKCAHCRSSWPQAMLRWLP